MPIPSDNPTVEPSKVFTAWWMKGFTVNASNANAPVSVSATFARMTDRDEYGSAELQSGNDAFYAVGDLFALAATDADVAALLDNLLTVVAAKAKAAGVID